MSGNLVSFAATEEKRQRLKQFALDVQREVCIRMGAHPPKTPQELAQYNAGLCEIGELDVIQEAALRERQ